MIVHSRGNQFMPEADVSNLCAALAGGDFEPIDGTLWELAQAHRVDALLAYRTNAQERLRAAAALSLAAERDLTEICDAAHRHGLDALLLKGAALAYTHYPEPHLRPYNDIDLLIRQDDRDRAAAMLSDIGYARDVETDAEFWSGQRHYVKTTASGRVMADVHWRVANPLVFADAFAFDEAWSRSIAVPGLGLHARTLAAADSLLLACLHRVAHHQDRVQLLCLWDIHLLVSHMSGEELAQFASSAIRARLGVVCARSLALSRECFGTAVPADVMTELQAATNEPSAAFVGASLSPFDVARADLAALPSWRDRASLVREHLFPSATYMRRRYPRWPAALLPIAYVHRMVRGAPRWFHR